EGLSRANHVGEQAVGSLENAPDGGSLVWMQSDRGAGSGQTKMIAVESAEAHVVEFVIVFAGQTFPPVIVLPDPLFETLLDFFLLVAGRFGGGRVDDSDVGFGIVVIDRGSAEIERVLQQFEGAAAVGAPFGCVGHTEPDAIIPLKGPKSKLGSVADSDPLLAEQLPGKPADVLRWNPDAAKARVDLRGRQVRRLDMSERVHIGTKLLVRHGGSLGHGEFGSHVARKILVLGFPQISLRIEKDGSLQLRQKLRGLAMKQV